jgi:hypothetical protein
VKDFNFEIWRLQSQSDIKGLVAALKDTNPLNRRAAAMALRTLSATTAIPGVQDALLQESDPELREILVTTLETLYAQNKEEQTTTSSPNGTSDNRNIVRLIARLSGSHTEQAVRAAQELGDSREKLTIEALMLTFNNRKMAPRVRLAVAEALLKLQSASSEITLLAALRSEKWMIRRNSAGVLGQIEADWAVEPLIQTLRDPIEGVRRVARAALEKIGSPEALAAIHAPVVPENAPQNTLVYDKPVGTVILNPAPLPPMSRVSPSPSTTTVDKPAAPVEKPVPSTSASTTSPPVAGLSNSINDGIKAAAILDEPPPSEEDTKPIRPLPDDVS